MTTEPALGLESLDQLELVRADWYSELYRAWDMDLGRSVAVKVLTGLPMNMRRLFVHEGRVAKNLTDHPHIVAPHLYGRDRSGVPFIVMDLAAGGSLQDHVDRKEPLSWRSAVVGFQSVCEALDFNHSRGGLHLAIKPSNILVACDTLKVTDFLVGRYRQLADPVVIDLAHQPPEVILGEPKTIAYDVYSLASTLYTVIAGVEPIQLQSRTYRTPFDKTPAPRIEDIQAKFANEIPVLPVADAPVPLAQLLSGALATRAEDRPQTIGEFKGQLAQLVGVDWPSH